MKSKAILCLFLFVSTYSIGKSQNAHGIIKGVKEKKIVPYPNAKNPILKKNIISKKYGILPLRKKYFFRGSSVWARRKFKNILLKRYKPYYENKKVFAIKRKKVVEVFPK